MSLVTRILQSEGSHKGLLLLNISLIEPNPVKRDDICCDSEIRGPNSMVVEVLANLGKIVRHRNTKGL